jgi:hypothetical protein
MVWVWTQTPELPSGASLSVSVSDWSFPDGLNWRTAWYTVMLYGKDWSPMRNCSLWRAVPWLITTAAWQHQMYWFVTNVYADIHLTLISLLRFSISVAFYSEHGHLLRPSPNLSPWKAEFNARLCTGQYVQHQLCYWYMSLVQRHLVSEQQWEVTLP